jgi:ferredoxin-nitrite reductase
MDNVRNLVGSPLAGIDPLELIDTRQLCIDLNNMITADRKGNPEFTNLPRKFNIAISGSRDDFAHTSINDIG